jgi:hypothetical protein
LILKKVLNPKGFEGRSHKKMSEATEQCRLLVLKYTIAAEELKTAVSKWAE